MVKIIIILLLISGTAWADVHGGISLGKDLKTGHNKAVIELEYRAGIKEVEFIPYLIYTNFFNQTEKLNNNKPFVDIYEVGARVEYRGFYVKYNHACAHEVISFNGYNMTVLEKGLLVDNTVDYITIGIRW